MLTRLRFLSAGESHGPKLTGILDGVPAGLALDLAGIQEELTRRRRGLGSGPRMSIESDEVRLTSGWMGGKTTGGPIAFEIENLDYPSWRDRDIAPMVIPRPGHADLTGAIKYGYRDLRLSLERASARETASRVASGAICRQLLGALEVEIGGYVTSIGPVSVSTSDDVAEGELRRRAALAKENDLACADLGSLGAMQSAIAACKDAGDTLGGTLVVFAVGLPPGLGSFTQWDKRLEARLALALMSIAAVKGVEIGLAFDVARLPGSKAHDDLTIDPGGHIGRASNRAGGIEGGVTTGEPVVARLAKKPISTTLTPRSSVDLSTGEPAPTVYERSDYCAVPRALPVAEAMLSLVLADALLEKVGGDSMDEIAPRLASLRRSHLDDLAMNNVPWRFGYE